MGDNWSNGTRSQFVCSPSDVLPPGPAPRPVLPVAGPPELYLPVPGQLDDRVLGALQHEGLSLADLGKVVTGLVIESARGDRRKL